jgi:hypothetical protein
MNGDASFGDECGQAMAIVAAQEASISKARRREGRHDERDDGLDGSGRRLIAGLLLADEAGAERSRSPQ